MIEVREGRFGKGLFAKEPIARGQVILKGWGYRVPHRTRHSIQVDHDTHIRFPSEIELINHSCEPNCGLFHRRGSEVLEIHALRWIEPGEELSTDYATFEDEILYLGPCECGAPSCRGQITGYKDLPDQQRRAYGEYVAEYLREIDATVSRAS